ncbi:MAG TPA: M43 family zinc metalloprotease [Blastocatellia bacterium]|nr:M43 family zinc metalloprotease [Blastocatellia bacterium]
MRLLTAFVLAITLALATMPAPRAQEKAQEVEQKRECGTTIPEGQLKVELARAAALGGRVMAPQANAPYYVPLTIHIVRQSDRTGGLSVSQLAVAMQDLNRAWEQGGIQFFIYGDIDYIDNDTFFNIPDSRAQRDQLRMVNPVADTINVYFTNLAGLCGESTFTTDNPQGVLMDINCSGVATNPSSFPHEIGHYFDLYHTHETKFGVECPSENNCSTAGDLVCDTAADPGLEKADKTLRVDGNCNYDNSAGLPGGCDKTLYNPPTRNLMSYSGKTCRDQITSGQISRALNVLTTTANRKNLINSFAKFASVGASSTNTACTYQAPCPTVNAAVAAAKSGDHIFINPGTYFAAPLAINKAVFLRQWDTGGPVLIR